MEAVFGLVVAGAALLGTWIARDKFLKGYNAGEQRVKAGWRSRRRDQDDRKRNQAKMTDNIVEVYRRSSRERALYVTATTAQPATLPLLYDVSSRFCFRTDESQDGPFRLNSFEFQEQPYDPALIARLRDGGRQLWDGPVLCVGDVVDTSPTVKVDLKVVNYFANVTYVERVVKETRNLKGATPLLTNHYGGFDTALARMGEGPVTLGADATCVFVNDQGKQVVALHRRSDSTVNASGLWTVTPAFTLEANRIAGETSQFGLIAYNLLKEVLEEIWDPPELREANQNPRAHPDWVFDNPAGEMLLAEYDAARVTMECLGAAIDLTHPCLDLALYVRFESPAFLKAVQKAPGSSEAKRTGPGKPLLHFIDITSDELQQKMNVDDMKVTSIFSLDRARIAAG